MKKDVNKKWLISAAAVLVTGILLLMNFYGLRSMSFELAEDTQTAASEAGKAYTPHLTFPKGEYEITLTGSGGAEVKTADGKELGSGKAGSAFTISLDKDESDIIIYGSELTKVDVKKTGMIFSDLKFISLFLILFLMYILYVRFIKSGGSDKDKVFMLLLAAAVFASYPLFSGTVGFGHDLVFHLYRIEGIKDGLLSGQFPVRVHPTHNNGYGYITASVYPDLFLYLPAVLRLFGVSAVTAYNTFLFAVNLATALIMYYCAQNMTRSRNAGLLASVVYTLSTWRIMNLYYRAAIGEALAMTFFPLVIYGIYCLLKGDKKKWWILALGCTGIFQSHVISTVFVALTLIAAVIVFIKDFISDKRWLGFIKAGILTVLLNLWYLAAFVKYYMGLDLAIKHTKENVEYFLNAIIPTELFNIFNTNFGYSRLLPDGVKGDMSLSLGVGVTLCFVVCAAYFIFRKKKELDSESFTFGMFAFAAILLFMSTTLFPWQIFQQSKLINAFCGTVRMPWRFLSLASPLLCIAAAAIAVVLIKNKNGQKILLAAVCFVCAVSFVSWGTAYTTQLDPALKKGCAVTGKGMAGLDNEYYVTGTKVSELAPDKYKTGGGAKVVSREKRGTNIEMEISGAGDSSYVEVPLLYYPGYSAKDQNGDKLETLDGDNHVMRVKLKDGVTSVRIKYSGFWYFKIADVISLLSVLGMILIAIKNGENAQKNNEL